MRRSLSFALWMFTLTGAASVVPERVVAQAPGGDELEVHAVHDDRGGDLGSVALPVGSCAPDAAETVRRGAALLHHMTYGEARAAFASAADEDPGCVLAHWGVAMTYVHPLWPDVPSAADLERGQAALERARSVGEPTPREDAFLSALEGYYRNAGERSEAERLDAFSAGWAEAHDRFPDDPEIRLFQVLSVLAQGLGTPDMVQTNARAGEMAEEVLAEIPDHPGALHYTIHAYDLPPLAERAEDVAQVYGEVAPANSHALHMTSHIFTRLGEWDESVHYNDRAAQAALDRPIDGQLSFHYLHAADYMVYGMLQRGDDAAARGVLADLEALEGPVFDHAASAYALAAIPTRILVERQAWEEAAELDPRWTSLVPWDRYPQLEAIPTFARGLGEARTGDTDAARASLERLGELRAAAAELPTSYDWATQVRIQELGLQAWIAYARGDTDRALQVMRDARELEATTVKNPITPSEVLPAAELLGDMLLELERWEEAEAAYAAALERSPNRLNSLYGAGLAAERSGDTEDARRYYRKLVDQVVEGADLERVDHARAYLEGR